MPITKAVITAAARGSRLFPAADTTQKAMLPLYDKDGQNKPLIQIIGEEAIHSGIQELCIVCAPGDQSRYEAQFNALRENFSGHVHHALKCSSAPKQTEDFISRITFREQKEPLGYGHAVCCAKDFIGSSPFLLLLSDHLYVSHHPELACAQQLIRLYETQNCPVSSVNPVHEHLVHRYGTLTGQNVKGLQKVYQINKILEKPSISKAELELHTTGMRAGYYLCFFGMHILTPGLMEILETNIQDEKADDRYGLTPALNKYAQSEKYLALEVEGSRYDISGPLGMLKAQIALGLAGQQRDIILSTISEILAEDGYKRGSGC